MAGWYVDEGLDRLIDEWKADHPGAVVGTIGDPNHSSDPDVTQHAPDDGGPAAGDDRGEVDGGDFMPGHGVTDDDLDDLFYNLAESRDPRILILIRRNKIVSSVVQPWKIRTYSGKYHHHTHVSVNDRFDANRADWHWENDVARTVKWDTTSCDWPQLQVGDEDPALKLPHAMVKRAQALANVLDYTLPALDCDGVYGANTARKVSKIMAASGRPPTAANGSRIHLLEWRVLTGWS
jgi:hypothetical protein